MPAHLDRPEPAHGYRPAVHHHTADAPCPPECGAGAAAVAAWTDEVWSAVVAQAVDEHCGGERIVEGGPVGPGAQHRGGGDVEDLAPALGGAPNAAEDRAERRARLGARAPAIIAELAGQLLDAIAGEDLPPRAHDARVRLAEVMRDVRSPADPVRGYGTGAPTGVRPAEPVCRTACGHHHDGDGADPGPATGPPCAACTWCRTQAPA